MSGSPDKRQRRLAVARAAQAAGIDPGLARALAADPTIARAMARVAVQHAEATVDGSTPGSLDDVSRPAGSQAAGNSITRSSGACAPADLQQADQMARTTLQGAAPAAVVALVNVVNDTIAEPRDRLAAAREILDRVYGRAVQPIAAQVQADVSVHFSGDLDRWSR